MTGSRDDEQDRERTVVASPSFDALLEAQEGERSTAVDARSYDDGDDADDWAQAPTLAAPSYDAQRAASGMTSLHEDEPTEQEPVPMAAMSAADENPWNTPPANPALPKTMILGPDAWGGAPPAALPAVPYAPPPPAPAPVTAAPAPARSRSGVMLFALTALATFVVGSCVVAAVLLMLLRS